MRSPRIGTAWACIALLTTVHCGGENVETAVDASGEPDTIADVTVPTDTPPGPTIDIAPDTPPPLPDVVPVEDAEPDVAPEPDTTPDTAPPTPDTVDVSAPDDATPDGVTPADTDDAQPDTADSASDTSECTDATDCPDALAAAGPCDQVTCEAGLCVTSPASDGTSCDDEDGCTQDDACSAGVCEGTPLDCSAEDSACTTGVCDPVTAECVAQDKAELTECDDGLPCTTGDVCVAGACQGTPADCSGLDTPCTSGTCDDSTGECVMVWAAEGSPCEDGSLCTTGDSCTGGVCLADPVVCEAQDDGPCQERVCDGLTGTCVAVPVADGTACEDGSACSYNDACTNGVCGGESIDCGFLDSGCRVGACQEPLGNCLELDAETGTPCDDDDVCTLDDQCEEGACTGTTLDCSEFDAPCISGQCSSITGECTAIPLPSLSACSDGDPCTADDLCLQGSCQGTALDCALPDSPCQDGACDPASGTCVTTNLEEGANCDDGLLCTDGDHCSEGACVGTGPDCSALDDGCLVGVCDDDTGGCKQIPGPDGVACDDGLFCTTDDSCSSGVCTGAALGCPDAGPCEPGVCDEETDACTTALAPNETPCDDQDPCTDSDVCQGGLCESEPRDCSHLNQPCMVGVCDQSQGECIAQVAADGTSCSDDDQCTLGDLCESGTCSGTPLDCTPLEGPCNTAACDSGTGSCVKTAINELMTCDDESKCTYNDRCKTGVCQGTPYDCSGLATPCATAECDLDTGACKKTNLPNDSTCDDDNPCTHSGTCADGYCLASTISCADYDSTCAIGTCDSDSGECVAVPKPDGTGCSIDNPCVFGTSCQSGTCTGTEKDCSDFDGPCSVGYCNEINGFCLADIYDDGSDCDDGEACTSPDQCLSGNCTGSFDLTTPGCDHPCAALISVDQNTDVPGTQLPFLYLDTTVGASDDTDSTSCGTGTTSGQGSPDLFFEFTVPTNGTYRFRLTDTSIYGDEALDAVLSLRIGACPSLPGSFCDGVVGVDIGDSDAEGLTRPLSAGSVIYIVVDGATPGPGGIFSLRVEELPTTEVACDDNFDDEEDGLTDCDDPDCDDDFQCLVPIPTGGLAFTELMPVPTGSLIEPDGQWIELRNGTDTDITLEHMWLAIRTWSDGEPEPGLPDTAHKFTGGSAWAQQYVVLGRVGSGNGGLTPVAYYDSVALDHTKHMRLQLVRAGWDGVNEPPEAYVIDDVTLPASPDLVAGRSWQLSVAAAVAADAAIQNDDSTNWCQGPVAPEIEYTPGNYGTPAGGGTNGTQGIVNGQNLGCD